MHINALGVSLRWPGGLTPPQYASQWRFFTLAVDTVAVPCCIEQCSVTVFILSIWIDIVFSRNRTMASLPSIEDLHNRTWITPKLPWVSMLAQKYWFLAGHSREAVVNKFQNFSICWSTWKDFGSVNALIKPVNDDTNKLKVLDYIFKSCLKSCN